MRKYYFLIFFLTCIFSSTVLLAGQTIGWIENVEIENSSFSVTAKIDTGADNSSLDSTDWQPYEKDGTEWIRFTVWNNSGKSLQLEKPLLRYTEIKRKQAEPVKRPVIEMDLCLAGKHITVPVNLADRRNFQYRMLIGRSALQGNYLVDSASTYTAEAGCTVAK